MSVEPLPRWNLDDLYDDLHDPRIDADITRLDAKAESLSERWKGSIATASVTAREFIEVITEYEDILDGIYRMSAYSSLMFSTNTGEPRCGALLQRIREAANAIYTKLVFIELEIGRIPEPAFATLITSTTLSHYRHYLTHQRERARHYLSEPEERVLIETSNTRGRAFARLFTEIHARTRYSVTIANDTKKLNQSETLTLLYDSNRDVRAAAATAITEAMKINSHTGTFIFNTLLHEKDVTDRLRGYDAPEASRHLANALPGDVVNTVTQVCEQNYTIVHDYYALKRRLLNLDSLTHYDRYAPLDLDAGVIPFSDARELVLDAFTAFSPDVATMARRFFDHRWIDAPPADGKQGGAFCAGVTPSHHPYVLLNFTGRPRDVMTLAHELGHGIHNILASDNSLINYHPVLPLAETASTFAEMLVFEQLRSRSNSAEQRLALICNKIEDSFATVFRQVAMYRFEQRCHRLRREHGEQPVAAFSEVWQTSMQAMFGSSLTLGEDHEWWWLYIPHVVHSPFYVYAYAFGELLVLALYAQYRKEGEPFIGRYLKLLRGGGSRSPLALAADIGVDLRDPTFWQRGCDLLRVQVEEASDLALQTGRITRD